MSDPERLENVKKICETWMFKKDVFFREKKEGLNSFYEKIKNIDFSAPINAFICRLSRLPYKFSKSEQVSGSICFFGGVFTSLLHHGYIKNIEHLFTFAFCYMLIDHFLDDDSISSTSKERSMKKIFSILCFSGVSVEENTGEQKDEDGDLVISEEIIKRYRDMIEDTSCLEEIKELFRAELEGSKICKNKNWERDIYFNNACEKGGYTALVIGRIIGIKKEDLEGSEGALRLGSLIQLVDDFLDISDDISLGIYTLIQYDIDHGNLDEYIIYCLEEINSLPDTYNFFKPILTLGVVLGLHDLLKNVVSEEKRDSFLSSELQELLSPYMIFDSETSKDTLNEWFHEKLYSYIEEKL